MKEQELFESDSTVFQEKEVEKKKKCRRKRYAKRKRDNSETGSQEQHGSQLLENKAESLQDLSTSEENPSGERLKEEVRKESAVEVATKVDVRLKAENLQKKGMSFRRNLSLMGMF